MKSLRNISRCFVPKLARFIVLAVYALPLLLMSAPPAWWAERNVLSSNATADDYAAVNQGQLKHIATQAAAELNDHLLGGAGTAINDLVASWSVANPGRDDYATVNHGQLKTMAKLFYERLIEEGYAADFPWASATNGPDHYAVANIGQVKHLFRFDLTLDVDNGGIGDGLPDWWEQRIVDADPNDSITDINGVLPGDDQDGDGLDNLSEYQQATNPNSNLDTDEDGVSNDAEIAQGSNPFDFFNGAAPMLTVSGGNHQGDLPGQTLAQPFAAKLSNALGRGKANTTITFSIVSGGGQLALVNSGLTDASGLGRATLTLPETVGSTVTVKANYGTVEVLFTATVGNSLWAPAAPGRPVITQEHGGTTALVEWADNSDNETAFYVERRGEGEAWTRIAELPANTTTYNDTNLVPDELNLYRIIAHNEAP